jgi:hypothetical protein
VEGVGRVLVVGESEDGILERKQRAGVYFQAEVQVERATTTVLGMELDFPYLAEGVRLDEMTLVVNMETMVD